MEYLLGWTLLAGLILLVWLVIHFSGGEAGESRPSCGLDGCGKGHRERRRG